MEGSCKEKKRWANHKIQKNALAVEEKFVAIHSKQAAVVSASDTKDTNSNIIWRFQNSTVKHSECSMVHKKQRLVQGI